MSVDYCQFRLLVLVVFGRDRFKSIAALGIVVIWIITQLLILWWCVN